jgi:hypothetical protein
MFVTLGVLTALAVILVHPVKHVQRWCKSINRRVANRQEYAQYAHVSPPSISVWIRQGAIQMRGRSLGRVYRKTMGLILVFYFWCFVRLAQLLIRFPRWSSGILKCIMIMVYPIRFRAVQRWFVRLLTDVLLYDMNSSVDKIDANLHKYVDDYYTSILPNMRNVAMVPGDMPIQMQLERLKILMAEQLVSILSTNDNEIVPIMHDVYRSKQLLCRYVLDTPSKCLTIIARILISTMLTRAPYKTLLRDFEQETVIHIQQATNCCNDTSKLVHSYAYDAAPYWSPTRAEVQYAICTLMGIQTFGTPLMKLFRH